MLCRGIRLDTQLVLYGVHDPLPGAEIPFGGFYGPVSAAHKKSQEA
jgi:hypothetical protein